MWTGEGLILAANWGINYLYLCIFSAPGVGRLNRKRLQATLAFVFLLK